MLFHRDFFCLGSSAACTGVSLLSCILAGCFFCYFSLVISMLFHRDFFCPGFITVSTGIKLFSCCCAGRFCLYYAFIPHMLHMISLCQFIRICSKRIICTVMIFLPGAPLNLRQSGCSIGCIEVSCSALCFMCLAACVYECNSADTFCSTAVIIKCIFCNIIVCIQTSVISDDSTNVCSICCVHLTGKCIIFKGICIPCLRYHDVTTKDTTNIVCTGNGSC